MLWIVWNVVKVLVYLQHGLYEEATIYVGMLNASSPKQNYSPSQVASLLCVPGLRHWTAFQLPFVCCPRRDEGA
jgi:hypothetical protein